MLFLVLFFALFYHESSVSLMLNVFGFTVLSVFCNFIEALNRNRIELLLPLEPVVQLTLFFGPL